MPEPRHTAWIGDQLRVTGPRRPWVLLIGLLVALLAADLLIAATPYDAREASLSDAGGVRARLRAAADEARARPTWLLVGDSVLAGSALQGALPSWRSQRVIDQLRREQSPWDRAAFHQVALDGLLPTDALRLARALDAVDPLARVALVVEINPRFFSARYADEQGCSRAHLCELGAPEARGALARARQRGAELRASIERWLPLYRHRRRFAALRDGLAPTPTASAEVDPLEGLARVLVHYQQPIVDARSAQARALQALAAQARASGRRVVFFATPLADPFASATGVDRGRYHAELDALLVPDGRRVSLLPMDSPLFAPEHFVDHVHLTPEGGRLLALNLLHQLGVGLARVPARAEMIWPEGPDASLLARIDAGYADGAAWEGQYARADGVAVAPGGRRVLLADPENHALREWRGDLKVMRTVAGGPERSAGDAPLDGPVSAATLAAPRRPVIVGDAVYFLDRDGRDLRRLAAGVIETIRSPRGSWRLTRLRAHRGRLLALDAARSQIVEIDPAEGSATVVVRGPAAREHHLHDFAISRHGALYMIDVRGRILRGQLGDELRLGEHARGVTVVFANTGAPGLPQRSGAQLPRPFAEVGLTKVVDLEYVDRYDGLLIEDELAQGKPGKYDQDVTERVLLRFFDLRRGLVHPWLKPLVMGHGHFYKNRSAETFASQFHRGSLAVDPETATLVYAEQDRSRVVRLQDGILGVAESSSITNTYSLGYRDVLGVRAGQLAFRELRPDLHMDGRGELLPRAGPYTALLVSSSLSSMTNVAGIYSLGRRVGERLRDALGYRDLLRLELFQRVRGGMTLEEAVALIEGFIDHGGRPDVVLIEAQSVNLLDDEDAAARPSRSFTRLAWEARGAWPKDPAAAQALERRIDLALAQLRASVGPLGARVLFYHGGRISGRGRDGLRPTVPRVRHLLERARAAGFDVVELGDALLEDHLSVTPFASPPLTGVHLTPWAVDAYADRLAMSLYPRVREHLVGRTPALIERTVLRPLDGATPDAAPSLADAFLDAPGRWAEALPRLPSDALQYELVGDTLVLFVDTAPLEAVADVHAPRQLAAAAVHELLVTRHLAAARVRVRVARFTSRDEYGFGANEPATTLYEATLDHDGLVALLSSLASPDDDARDGGRRP